MSLYFLRSIDTWSLNKMGSSLIWEWTRGMLPNQLANLFMQVCRWAKWSGSAQREARDVCWGGGRKKKGKKEKKSHLGESTTFIMQYVHFLFHLEIMRHVSGWIFCSRMNNRWAEAEMSCGHYWGQVWKETKNKVCLGTLSWRVL